MKCGTLVAVKGGDRGTTHWLYGGDERNSLIATDTPFGFGDIGVVLSSKKMVPGKHTLTYIKMFTPRGIGWIFETHLVALQ